MKSLWTEVTDRTWVMRVPGGMIIRHGSSYQQDPTAMVFVPSGFVEYTSMMDLENWIEEKASARAGDIQGWSIAGVDRGESEC